jgi:Domain of unknown function (DUF4397)
MIALNPRKVTARFVVLCAIGVALPIGLLITSMMAVTAQSEDAAGLRIVHTGIDTPPVNVSVNGELVAENLFWLEATDYLEIQAGDHEISIFDPDISVDEALSTVKITTDAGNNYSAIITGELPKPSIVLITDGDKSGVETGMGAVRFFHSVPDAGPIDVATSGGTLLAESVELMTASDYVMVAPGEYDIEFREAGTGNVLYTEVGVTIEEGAFQTAYLSGLAELTNFAAETFIDEFRGSSGAAGGSTATETPVATATPEPAASATPEPKPTATAIPVVGMPSTGAGGAATEASGANLALLSSLAVLFLAAGGGLLLWTRRVT